MPRKLLLLLLSLLCPLLVFSQNKLTDSSFRSPYTYRYKITDAEARNIVGIGTHIVKPSFFHSLVDSFPLNKPAPPLPQGHFLYLHASGPDLVYRLETSSPLQVKLLLHKPALSVVVHDTTGAPVTDAWVSLGRQKATFDAATQTYVFKRSPKKGLLQVQGLGSSVYRNLGLPDNYRYSHNLPLRILHSFPLRYVWQPIQALVQTIRWGQPQGWVIRVAALFDEDYRRDKSSRYTGYLVTNKLQYQPGDTVRYKAFVVRAKGNPVKEKLKLQLQQADDKKVTLLLPPAYRAGAYEGFFTLHDSLKLQLDKPVILSLARTKGQQEQVVSRSFSLEDYELKENSYTLRLEHERHQVGQENRVYLRGTDANGLNLLDARVQLLVLTQQVLQSKERELFVPDTLWRHEQPLNAAGETAITIPNAIFPNASVTYEVAAAFLNSGNERSTTRKTATYVPLPGQLKFTLLQDSLQVQYLEGEQSKPMAAVLAAYAADDAELTSRNIMLPLRLPLNPHAEYYSVQAGNLKGSWSANGEQPQLQVYAERSPDSVYMQVHNPRRLPFWYYVYRGEKLLEQGHGQEPLRTLSRQAKSTAPYFIAVRYVWAGKVGDAAGTSPHRKYQLNMALEGPDVVYPGQKATYTVAVTDVVGKPVPDVDLTAYAITSKFQHQNIPAIPVWDRYKPQKPFRRLQMQDEDDFAGRSLMVWERWSRRLGLDTLAQYRFLYPPQGLFTDYSFTSDSLTQVSPFVVDSGRMVPVHVVYIDAVPVYYSQASILPAYAFAADSGYHSISLRTTNKLIKLDSVYLQHRKRLILSADITALSNPFAQQAEKGKLTDQERNRLYGYMLQVEQNFGNDYTYLKQGQHVQLLQPGASFYDHTIGYQHNRNGRYLVGPFKPNYMQFHRLGQFSTNFRMEAGYSYLFEPSLLKMRESKTLPDRVYLPHWDKRNHTLPDLRQQALTEERIQEQWQAVQEQQLLGFMYTRNPEQGITDPTGNLGWALDSAIRQQPVVALLLPANTSSDSLHIYGGNTNLLRKLLPGSYTLVLLFKDESNITRQVQVQANGLTKLYLKTPDLKESDNHIKALLKQLEKRKTAARQKIKYLREEEQQQLQLRQATTYTYNDGSSQYSHLVSGTLTDKDGKTPLPGVSIKLKNTTIATVTDAQGAYRLYVPENGVLVFGYLGYTTTEEDVNGRSRIDVSLSADVRQLQEVVVVGYSTQTRSSMSASVTTVQGALAGSAAGITIRGLASVEANKTPLIVLDGIPYGGKLEDLDATTFAKVDVLTGEKATGLYGIRGANGVMLITTNKGIKAALAAEAPADDAAAIRDTFSDYAFWSPRLRTDQQGKATFSVTYPGDITSWNTYLLGMDGKKSSGLYSKKVRSFKAVMATLSMPRFLVEGDQTQLIGKALNYLPDSAAITTGFELGGKVVKEQQHLLKRSLTDTLFLTAPAFATDSVEVQYGLRQEQGMADGERRFLKVYPKGVKQQTGYFMSLASDTTFTLTFDPAKGPVKLYVQGDLLQVMLDEIEQLHTYVYWCSEQAASKLKGLLLEKRIREQLKQPFAHERMVRRLIRHLEKTQLPEGAWAWWEAGPPAHWVTSHVAEALVQARSAGFATKFNEQKLIDYLVYRLNQPGLHDKITMLETLRALQVQLDYPRYIQELEKEAKQPLEHQLRLTHLRQLLHLEAPLDTLQKHRQTTMLGGVFWGQRKRSQLNNNITGTVLAYTILKTAGGHEQELQRIVTYLLSERQNGKWQNTYESAKVLETLVPDILNAGPAATNSLQQALQFSGALATTAAHFPVDTTFAPLQPLVVHKKGKLPLYLTAYQTNWNPDPQPVQKDFVVSSAFKGMGTSTNLKAGEPVELVVQLEVKADADYVMLEVPIPAGCSYDTKESRGAYEVHRSYFRDKVSVFAEHLPKGTYTYTIKLLPRFAGSYTLNPVKAELMYFPVFIGQSELKKVSIK